MDEKTNVIGDVKMELPSTINTENIVVADTIVTEKKIIEFTNEAITPEAKTEIPSEIPPEIPPEIPIKEDSLAKDIFIEETDTFDIKVNYYKKDDKIIVENIDPEFENNKDVKSFTVTLKYPSYLDMQSIQNHSKIASEEKLGFSDLINLQNVRILVLIRKWSLSDELDKIDKINAKFMKAIRVLVMNKIGMEGIM
jgi:hypothetical protein